MLNTCWYLVNISPPMYQLQDDQSFPLVMCNALIYNLDLIHDLGDVLHRNIIQRSIMITEAITL
jgi:hypothetical protein